MIKSTVIKIAESDWGTFKPYSSSVPIYTHPIVFGKENIITKNRLNVRTDLRPDKTKLQIKEIIKLD